VTIGPLPFEDARAAVVAAAAALPVGEMPLDDALGLYLAVDVIAETALQPFDNSAMDGYAVRATDLVAAAPGAPVALVLVGESRAGRPAAVAVGAGQAIAVSTGAMLPEGADAVVRREDTRRSERWVEIFVAPAPGAFVRRVGDDVAVGDTVLRPGSKLGPAALGVLAGLGVEAVTCRRRPTVAVVTSGDELVPPGESLWPGGIRDSNGAMLAALVAEADATLRCRRTVGDDLGATFDVLGPALDADVLVICGGVSVGAHDHVKLALDRLGVKRHFWRIGLKPGGPTYFGSRDGTLVFGLPGNPVSTFATFTLLVAPALEVLAGGSGARHSTPAVLASPYTKETDRVEAIRCALELTARGWQATPLPNQASHFLTSILGADCLAILPGAARRFDAGERVEVEMIGALDRRWASIGP
jgi:molybdopterin molybdotransferase